MRPLDFGRSSGGRGSPGSARGDPDMNLRGASSKPARAGRVPPLSFGAGTSGPRSPLCPVPSEVAMSTQRGHGSRRAGAGGTITDVGGVLAGHARDRTERTGVTALLFNRPTRGAVEVRGGAPGTFGTDALAPLGCFGTLGGLFLSGGSLFGLDAA